MPVEWLSTALVSHLFNYTWSQGYLCGTRPKVLRPPYLWFHRLWCQINNLAAIKAGSLERCLEENENTWIYPNPGLNSAGYRWEIKDNSSTLDKQNILCTRNKFYHQVTRRSKGHKDEKLLQETRTWSLRLSWVFLTTVIIPELVNFSCFLARHKVKLEVKFISLIRHHVVQAN